MNMLEPTIALENVKAGYSNTRPYDARSYLEYLMDFIDLGMIDQEEAQLAIIEGSRKRAKVVLKNVSAGYDHVRLGTDKTYGEELRELVDRGYVDQEDAHLASYQGRKRIGKEGYWTEGEPQ